MKNENELTFGLDEFERLLLHEDCDAREIVANYVHGYTVEEIACLMKTTPDVVKERLAETIRHLRCAKKVV